VGTDSAAHFTDGRIGIASQKCNGLHDHTALAVPALRYVALRPFALNARTERVFPKTFDGGDRRCSHRGNRQPARPDRSRAKEHGTRSAMPDAATIFRTDKTEFVSQHPQDGRVGKARNRPPGTVHKEIETLFHDEAIIWKRQDGKNQNNIKNESTAMRVFEFGPFRVSESERSVSVNGGLLPLGDKVVETLIALLEHPGETCAVDALIAKIWPEGYIDRANLAQNIYVLRKTLGEYWDRPTIETVRRRGYRLRVPVRVIAATLLADAHRETWSFLGRCAGVAAAILLVLLPGSGMMMTRTASLDSRAGRLYNLGYLYWNMRGRENTRRALEYFRELARERPSNAQALSALAYTYAVLADYDYGPESSQAYATSLKATAERALALDPNLSDAHVAMAKAYKLVDGDLASAETEFLRAINLSPSNSVAHHWYGVMLMQEGKLIQSRREIEIAARLDPANPSINSWLAVHRYLSRDYSAAIAYDRLSLALQPDNIESLVSLGFAFEQMRAFDAALDAYRKVGDICHCLTAKLLEARVIALRGDVIRAQALVDQAVARSGDAPPDAIAMAAALAALGKRDAALHYASMAFADPYERLWVTSDPRLDALRSDARWNALTSS
jgi:DNA-binding winged helix-turn-helix (wHTH) protein